MAYGWLNREPTFLRPAHRITSYNVCYTKLLRPSPVKIEYLKDGVYTLLCTGKVPELALFAKTTVVFNAKKIADINTPVEIKVTIDQENQKPAVLSGAVIIR